MNNNTIFNNDGKIVFFKNEETNTSVRYFYDEKGQKTSSLFIKYQEDTPVFKIWEDFNASGDKIHSKKSNGYEEWMTYDSKHRMQTHKKLFPDGSELFVKYDKKGNEIVDKKDEKNEKDEKSSILSLINVIQYCSLAILVFVSTTFLWQQIDIAQFGASLPSNTDTVSSVMLTFTAIAILYFKNKVKKP